jgi:C4-dicarboxylate-binding protein DctP
MFGRRSMAIGPALSAAAALALLLAACAPQRAEQPKQAPPADSGAKPGEAAKAAPAAAPGAMTLKFSHVVAKNTPKGKASDKFAEIVKDKSGGKIEVQVFHNSELYKDAEEMEALQTGAIHFIAPGTDKFGSLAPQWDATALPYLFTSEAAVKKFLDPDNPVAQELFEGMRPKGLLGLGIWGNGFKHFSNSKKPIKVPSDFQGLKIRTSGKPDEAFVKVMGGSAQVMAFSEVFGALQQGVVDGQYNTWSNILTQKFHEVQRYVTISRGGTYLAYGVGTNAKWWDELDADSKKILTDAMKEATAYHNQLADKENEDALAEIRSSGRLEFYEQTPEDSKAFQEAGEKVVAEWEPRMGKEIIDKLKAMN